MMAKRILVAIVFVTVLAALVQSCKDLGDALALTASSFSVILNPGGQAVVTIRGGNPPYAISRQPDTSLATATLTNNVDQTGSLVIQATSRSVSGTTSVKVKDSHTHDTPTDALSHEENEIEIEIRVTPAAGTVSFATQVQPIFTNSCVNAGCHPGGGAPFSLAAGESYNQLVNQNATVGPCQAQKRVQPGDTTNSVLVKRLEGSTCGSLMPLGGSQLPAASIQLIKSWISQGAQNN